MFSICYVPGRSPGVGNRNSLQYSCLENSMYKEAWQVIVHGVTNSQAWLSGSACVAPTSVPSPLFPPIFTSVLWVGWSSLVLFYRQGKLKMKRDNNLLKVPQCWKAETWWIAKSMVLFSLSHTVLNSKQPVFKVAVISFVLSTNKKR